MQLIVLLLPVLSAQRRCRSTAGKNGILMRQRYLWALIPAALAMGSFGIQMTISAYDGMQGGPYGTSPEVRWLVELGIYLTYLAGLASFDVWRRGRIQMATGVTVTFAILSVGMLSDSSSIGGGLFLLLGWLLNFGFGLLLLGLVVKRYRLPGAHQGPGPDVVVTVSP